MAIITTNGSFGATAAVTSTTLNAVADAATFSDPVDGTSLELKGDGKLGIKDAGVTTAKVADSSSKTTGVTFAKMQHISTAKVLGRTSASEGDVEEVDLLDQDDMSSNSATSVATQQSIKAYVDTSKTSSFTPSTYIGEESVTLPNRLTMKFGSKSVSGDSTASVSFATAFPGNIVQVQLTIKTNIPLNSDAGLSAISQTPSGFTIQNGASGTETISWMAIGY